MVIRIKIIVKYQLAPAVKIIYTVLLLLSCLEQSTKDKCKSKVSKIRRFEDSRIRWFENLKIPV